MLPSTLGGLRILRAADPGPPYREYGKDQHLAILHKTEKLYHTTFANGKNENLRIAAFRGRA